MKLFLAAVALTIASPALAQADPHAGHGGAGHEGHAPPAGAQKDAPADPHAGHDMKGCCEGKGEGKMDCCAKMKAEGKKMACCDKMGTSAAEGEARR